LNSLGFHPWATYGLSPFSMGTKKPPAGGFLDGCGLENRRWFFFLDIAHDPLVTADWLKGRDKAQDMDFAVPAGGELG
jgi:hypothetical protein